MDDGYKFLFSFSVTFVAVFSFCQLIIWLIRNVFGFIKIIGQSAIIAGLCLLKTTLLAIMIVISYFALLELHTTWKYWRTGRHPDDGLKTQNIIYTESDCVICYERQSNVLLLPCLHLCICQICCRKLYQSRCPICRETIEDKFIRMSSLS